MDKYEFKVKVEQLKKMVDKGDYETAMKIADGIDWRRVRSTSLLSLVSTVYERNDELQDAKDILLLAFERAPQGKGLLFKLTDLALRSNDIKEAEVYYSEFCDLCDDDPRQNLLRFRILEAKDADINQQINSLERYCKEELDEKWMYRLAEVYQKAGRTDDCVRVCDKIMLMFGIGKYVDQAMQLKLKYAPLNSYQMDLVENREKYEEKLRAVEEQYREVSAPEPEEEAPAEESEEWPVAAPAEEQEAAEEPAAPAQMTIEEEAEPEMPVVKEVSDVELEASIKEAEATDELAKEISKIDAFDNADDEEAETRVFKKITAPVEEPAEEPEEEPAEEAAVPAAAPVEEEPEMPVVEELDDDDEEEEEVPVRTSNHLMIEAVKPENGLALALESLKEIHKEIGSTNSVAKISGEKLSKKGIFALASKIEGKDLVIERAADLDDITIDELNELMERDETGILVVLIDTPSRLERLHKENPELAGRFQYIGCDGAAADEVPEEEVVKQRQETEEARRRLAEREEEIRRKAARDAEEAAARKAAAIRAKEEERLAAIAAEKAALEAEQRALEEAARAEAEEARRATEEEEARRRKEYEADRAEPSDEDDDAVMDVEEFAQYASKYAEAIDCSISGKSMLALYGRAEMMEEDGIPLTKQAAEDLIEEAADKAEKKSFGDIFSSKYNKDGLLILKEKHFYD